MYIRSIANALLLVLISAVLGCAPLLLIHVDSITAPEQPSASTFILLPGREGVAVNDLQFREFAGYVDHALRSRGFKSAPSTNDADIAVFLNYGIGEPEVTAYTYSLPVYGQTGGGTATYSGSTYGPGGSYNTTGTIEQAPTFGVVGSQTHTLPVTTYFRYLILDAVDLRAYRESGEFVPIWKTTITSTGSSGDLRRVFPVLVGAATEHIATNTSKQVQVELYESDPRVQQVTGQ